MFKRPIKTLSKDSSLFRISQEERNTFRECFASKNYASCFEIVEQIGKKLGIILEFRCFPNFLKSDLFIDFQNGLYDEEEGIPEPSPPKYSFHDPLVQAQNVIPENSVPKLIEAKKPTKTNPWIEKEALGDIYINNDDGLKPNHIDVRDKETGQVQPENRKIVHETETHQVLRNTHNLKYIPEQDNRKYPNAIRTLKRGQQGEIVQENFGFLDEAMPKEAVRTNAAYAYNIRSSTVNYQSRQASEFRSMVTDTSDSYSSFSTEDPKRVERRQFREERRHMRASANTNTQAQNDLNGRFKAREAEDKDGYNWAKIAQDTPQEFFKFLNYKLKKYKEKVESKENFRKFLRAQAEERKSNPSMSIVDGDFDETDQVNILNHLLISKCQEDNCIFDHI